METIAFAAWFALNLVPVSLALGLVMIYEDHHREVEPIDVRTRLGPMPRRRKNLVHRSTGRAEFRARIYAKQHPWVPDPLPNESPVPWLEQQRTGRWHRS